MQFREFQQRMIGPGEVPRRARRCRNPDPSPIFKASTCPRCSRSRRARNEDNHTLLHLRDRRTLIMVPRSGVRLVWSEMCRRRRRFHRGSRLGESCVCKNSTSQYLAKPDDFMPKASARIAPPCRCRPIRRCRLSCQQFMTGLGVSIPPCARHRRRRGNFFSSASRSRNVVAPPPWCD